jgi:hypothetical protein
VFILPHRECSLKLDQMGSLATWSQTDNDLCGLSWRSMGRYYPDPSTSITADLSALSSLWQSAVRMTLQAHMKRIDQVPTRMVVVTQKTAS